jgi:hypothetical protein
LLDQHYKLLHHWSNDQNLFWLLQTPWVVITKPLVTKKVLIIETMVIKLWLNILIVKIVATKNVSE